jgi:rhamnosyltransferase subunit B
MNRSRRYVFTSFGSFGDIHPYIPLCLELQRMDQQVLFVTSEYYREKITRLGIDFAPSAPVAPDLKANPHLMAELMDLKKGPERIIRGLVMPVVKQSYLDLKAVVRAGDILISHPITYATSIVAEEMKLKWISTVLQPAVFFSAQKPPVVAPAQWLQNFKFLGPNFYRGVFGLASILTRNWAKPWFELRRELGLPKLKVNPVMEAQHSPLLVLALFSKYLAEKQSDWPPNTLVTGFPFYDADDSAELNPELSRFLDQGPAPLVFTLGTSAVKDARNFYTDSLTAARALGMRAVFLTGKDNENPMPQLSSDEIAVGYAPYSKIFPRACINIHQGGAGTTGQAMRSGRPMIVMPYSHDQPDHAARIVELGIGQQIHRARYNSSSAAATIKSVLNNQSIAEQSHQMGQMVSAEDGVRAAVEALLAI